MRKIYESKQAAQRASYWRRREENIARRREFRLVNRERINAQRREKYRTSADKQERVWASNLQRRTGCTREQYAQMWAEQEGLCAVCKRELLRDGRGGGDRRACVDHCHRTMVIRGLLCHRCNIFLGMLDDEALSAAGLNYKRKYDLETAV